jgi:hypothetical protein
MLVIGSRNSSNSVRLVEGARACGTEAHLIDNSSEVREEWLRDRRVVGISSGASAPDELVQELLEFFRACGVAGYAVAAADRFAGQPSRPLGLRCGGLPIVSQISRLSAASDARTHLPGTGTVKILAVRVAPLRPSDSRHCTRNFDSRH